MHAITFGPVPLSNVLEIYATDRETAKALVEPTHLQGAFWEFEQSDWEWIESHGLATATVRIEEETRHYAFVRFSEMIFNQLRHMSKDDLIAVNEHNN